MLLVRGSRVGSPSYMPLLVADEALMSKNILRKIHKNSTEFDRSRKVLTKNMILVIASGLDLLTPLISCFS